MLSMVSVRQLSIQIVHLHINLVLLDVTIFQRSSTYIMTTKEGMPRLMKRTSHEKRL